MDMLAWALAYVQRGWAVFPLHELVTGRCSCGNTDCPSPGKHPRIKKGLHNASRDERIIRGWWGRWTTANIGIRTDGLCVIDIDPAHGGRDSLVALEQAHAPLPPTYTVSTGGNGTHFYFIAPNDHDIRNRANIAPGIDIRGNGGYVVAPPSNHSSGRTYEIAADRPLIEPPQWLLDLVIREESEAEWTTTNLPQPASDTVEPYALAALENELSTLAAASKGTRNATLNSVAFSLFQLVKAAALDETTVRDDLRMTAQAIGLGNSEIDKTIESAYKSSTPRDLSNVGTKRKPSVSSPNVLSEMPEEEDETESHNDQRPTKRWPYKIENNTFYYMSRGESGFVNSKVIADFAVRIVGEHTTEDEGRTFQLAGHTAQGTPINFSIGVHDFTSEPKLKAMLTTYAGANAPIRAGMLKHLAPAIQMLSATEIRRTTQYTRTGWTGETFLIPGREHDGVSIKLPHKLPYSVNAEAPSDESTALALESLRALLRAKPSSRSTIALSFVLGAPLARLAGWQNERYGLFIAGRSGNLKSSWSQALMSLYGAHFLRDDLLIKWGEGATRNAVMALAAHAHDMPFLIDNYKPNTGNGHKDFTNLIHNLVEGGEKDRLNRAAELRESKAVFCWPLATGEDVPDSDPASLARVLVVPFSESNDAEKTELALVQERNSLSLLGSQWLDWLESEDGQRCAKRAAKLHSERRNAWAKKLTTIRADMVNVLRVASNLATNELVWLVMAECPLLQAVADEFGDAHLAGLEEVAALMADYTAESLEASRFVHALRELLASGRAELRSCTDTSEIFDRDRMIGWKDDEYCYLLPTISRSMVDKLLGPTGLNGLSERTLYTQLQSLGHIAASDPGRQTKIKRVGGKVERVLWLHRKDICPAEGLL